VGLSKLNHKLSSLWDAGKIIQYKGQFSLKMLEHHNTKSNCGCCKRLNISDLFGFGAQTLSEKLKLGVKKLQKCTADQAVTLQKCIIYSCIIIIRYGVFALQSKSCKSVSCYLLYNPCTLHAQLYRYTHPAGSLHFTLMLHLWYKIFSLMQC